MNSVQIENLTFQYESTLQENTLQDINLTIRKGECIVLTGESGCGKTTLTRCINGLIPNFFDGTLSGEILCENQPVNKMEQYKLAQYIGSVFQDPRSQFFTVNTTDEVAFGCENLAFSTEHINRNIDKAFSRMKIENLRGRSLFELSSGEKQRVAVASIYAMDTDIILLDEPTANLDEETIQMLRELLFTLKVEEKTIILSEHRLSWLSGLADRYIYLKNGKIEHTWSALEASQLTHTALQEYGLRSIQEPPLKELSPSLKKGEKELTFQDICVCYGKKEIICNLNHNITWGTEGKIIGILGKNGSGKTTFAKVLCGLIKAKSGTIYLNSKKMNTTELVKSTYFVMQDADYQLFTESVVHEIELAARKNLPKKNTFSPEDTENTLQEFGLEEYLKRHPLSLSGGQKQRVTIAAAIASNSEILVFDEPTSGLDGKNMRQLKITLQKIKKQGKLIFIITHDTEFLNGLTDEIMNIKKIRDKELL